MTKLAFEFIKDTWYIAAWSDDVREKPVARRICGVPVVLYRTAGGEASALFDRCCHRGAPLSLGTVTESGLECGYHGMVFERSGACVSIPGQGHIPAGTRVRSFPVVEKDTLLWIWMGDPAKADPALIIDYPYHSDVGSWQHRHSTMRIAASYTLMVDNLMDASHVGYVHRATIGGSAPAHMNAKTEIEQTPRGLKFTRWIVNHEPPPGIRRAMAFPGNITRWQEFEYVAPAVIKHWGGSFDAGIPVSEQAREDAPYVIRILHGVTPETETSCIYSWSLAIGFGEGKVEAIERQFGNASAVFTEDILFLEEQQRLMLEYGEDGLVDMHTDGARVSMRRINERLLAAERAGAWEPV